MSKATIFLITLAALGLGTLIGTSLVDNETPVAPVPAPQTKDETSVASAPAPQAKEETPAIATVSRGGAPLFRYFGPDEVSVQENEFGETLPSALGENYIAGKGEYRSETVTIRLEALGKTEYKALMQQGGSIVYSWITDKGEVYYDFHAHDESFGDGFFTRYAEGEGVADSGMIAAPYKGQHGWFWLNLEDRPLTITLKVAGFYDEIIEIDLESPK